MDLGPPANEENERAGFKEATLVIKRKAIIVVIVSDRQPARFWRLPPGVHSLRYN